MKKSYGFVLAVLGALSVSVACKQREFGGSEVKLDTTNSAGIPKPRESMKVVDVVLPSAEMLKVIGLETSNASVQNLGDRDCAVAKDNGPHRAPDLDCSEVLQKRVQEATGFTGIMAQNFRFNAYSGQYPWNVACQPSKIRLQMHAKTLEDGDGVNIYLNSSGVAGGRTIPASEIYSKGQRNGEFVEADFIVLAKCNNSKAEFKPYFVYGLLHKWQAFEGNHTIQ
jgi:hypothetical protein